MAALLAGCQSLPDVSNVPNAPSVPSVPTVANTQAIFNTLTTHKAPIVAYFDAHWKLAKKPVAGGFYRKLYAQDPQGHYLVQDFYQDTQSSQTSGFWVFDTKGLTASDNRYTTGEVAWYDKKGALELSKTYYYGRYIGDGWWYFPDGKPYIVQAQTRTTQHVTRFYTADPATRKKQFMQGRVVGDMNQQVVLEVFDANGAVLLRLKRIPQQKDHLWVDPNTYRNGKPHPSIHAVQFMQWVEKMRASAVR